MNVVSLSAERDRRESEAWQRYVAAKTLADETHSLEHGQAAKRAWQDFIDLFAPPAQAEFMEATAGMFGRRA